MNHKFKLIFSLLFVTFLCLTLSVTLQLFKPTSTAFAGEVEEKVFNEEHNQDFYLHAEGGYLSFETSKVHYLQNETIIVSYISHFENGIADVSYYQDGFNVLSLTIDQEDNKVFTVNVSYEPDRVDYSLQLQVEHIGGELAIVELHGYLNEYGMFISQFSPDSAREEFYNFAKSQNLMTEEECRLARDEFWSASVYSNLNNTLDSVETGDLSQGQAALSTTSNTIEVKGNLYWEDDLRIPRKLRYVKVEVYRSYSCDVFLGSDYADDTGHYSIMVDKSLLAGNSNYNIYIKVYASDDNVTVRNGTGNVVYSYAESEPLSVNYDTSVSHNFTFRKDSELVEAMQISQALFTARNYAQVHMGVTPAPVNAYYPTGSGFHYVVGASKILLGKHTDGIVKSYAAWDPIMHEYGHHIQWQINNSNTPSLDHAVVRNEIDFYNDKDLGSRLAWGESWATVFGMLAQQYYSSELNGINYTRNEVYESYYSQTYNLETANALLGDGCELSIMGVLWDLYDSEFDTNDLISLGHTAFWNLTAVDGFETFSDFVNNLYEEYPEYTYALGQNLTYYKMATTAPVMTNSSSVSQTVPPTFTWTPQGGSVSYPNNSFQIVIFDANHEEIFRTASTTSTSYTLTQSQWQSTLFSFGQSYCVAVVATQTAAPITGGYISAFSFFGKPSASALSETFTISASNRYTEKVVNLQPSQYIDYNVTLQSGTKLIQTFGTCDVVMEIYDANGTLLEELDDQGCGLNSLATLNVVSDNAQYKIRLFLYNPEKFGTVKLAIIPANSLTVSGYTSINEYSQIYRINTDSTNYVYATSCEQGYMSVLRYAPTSSGYYQVTLSSDFDNYLYIIDPRSTEFLVFDKDYHDDWDEEDTNAYLNVYFEQGVDYLIVFGPSYLTADLDDGYIMLRFRKFD